MKNDYENKTLIGQAVILAGGKGTRLRPLTYEKPKVMLEVNKKPFLWYTLQLLKKRGIYRILILAGYLGEQIEGYFGKGDGIGLNISYSYDRNLLGTGGALKKAQKLLSKAFCLINGDTYFDFNYRAMMQNFHDLNCKGLICVYTNRNKDMKPNVLLADNGLIVKYDKNNPQGLNGVDAGVGIFKKDILQIIPKGRNISLEMDIYKKLIAEKQLCGYPLHRKFLDMGMFKNLDSAKRLLR
jgi:NDP-sugar pyrophosphorylase family protein